MVYKSNAEVMGLLDNSKPKVISNLRPDAAVFVPKPRVNIVSEEVEDAEPEEIEEPEVDNTDIVGAGTSESISITALPEANLPPSEEQIHATRIIQIAYRKLLRRRHKSTKSALEASRASFFDECLKESLKMEWPNGIYYRLLFLGPLPHVLACLSVAHSWAFDTKARNKERLTVALHQELEDVLKRLTEHTYGLVLFLSDHHLQYPFCLEKSSRTCDASSKPLNLNPSFTVREMWKLSRVSYWR